jgi:hypothetical protein
MTMISCSDAIITNDKSDGECDEKDKQREREKERDGCRSQTGGKEDR